MEKYPHNAERARLPGIRRAGESPAKGKSIYSSRGTPLVGQTVTVFSHPVELIGADGVTSRTIEAIVDTGASYLTAPQGLLRELGILAEERVPLRLADGRRVERDLGEARVRILGRRATTSVVFAIDSDPILLGSHALEAVRLAVDPYSQRLVDFTPLL